MSEESPKIIIGLNTLANVLKVSKNTVYQYMKMGMPGKLINGKWHFHWNNIEKWFENATNEVVEDPENIQEENMIN